MAPRTWIIEEEIGPDGGTGTFDVGAAAELAVDLIATLARVGGMVSMAAERIQVAETPFGDLVESRRLIVNYQMFTPMRSEAPPAAAPERELDEEPDDEYPDEAPDRSLATVAGVAEGAGA